MSTAGTIDATLEQFGGLVTDIAPTDVADGVSPDCQDVAFPGPGSVKTRPGLVSAFAALGSNPTINYAKTYRKPNLVETLLMLDSSGKLWSESTGAPTQLNTNPQQLIAAGSYAKSWSLFGREYIAFHDGKFGIDIPRQLDASGNLDRVSQSGPGAAPTLTLQIALISSIARASGVVTVNTSTAHGLVSGDTVALNGVSASGSQISSISRANGTVTVNLSSGINAPNGSQVYIVGVANSSTTTFNGHFVVASGGGAATTSFTFAQTGPDEAGNPFPLTADAAPVAMCVAVYASGDGTQFDGVYAVASIASSTQFTFAQLGAVDDSPAIVASTATAHPVGNIVAGVHQAACSFITRTGYITKPSPPATWTAGVAPLSNTYHTHLGQGYVPATLNAPTRVQVSTIPVPSGLVNVVARLLMFTAANQATFFYIDSTMQINDITTTSFVVDFSDTALQAGTNASSLFRLHTLAEVAGFIGYGNRLIAWGERNYIDNFLNLDFDGGFGGAGNNVPNGWTPDGTFFAGGGRDTSGKAVWGTAYQILGDGVTVTRGLITQGAITDYLGVPILQPGVAYSVRARICSTGALAQGNLIIDLWSTTLGLPYSSGIVVTAAQVTGNMVEYTGPLTTSGGAVPLYPDTVLRVRAVATPTNGAGFVVDNIEVYPTNQPYLTAQARVSNVDDPESFDGITGVLAPQVEGQALRNVFAITDRSELVDNDHLHLAFESALMRTQDNGNEPAAATNGWDISIVSSTIGTPSVDGCDVGEDWVVMASATGVFLYSFGTEPTKISQEIQPTWARINMQNAQRMWIRVDTLNKRIMVGAPLDGASVPNKVLVCDYRGLVSSSDILRTPPVHFSQYSGKQISLGLARKWCLWNIAANCCWFEPPATAFAYALQTVGAGAGAVWLGNSVANGKMYYLSDSELDDDGAAISSYYTSYFFLTPTQEQGMQLRAHRKLFTYLTMAVEGSGTLALTAYPLDLSNAQALPSVALSSPCLKDLEMTINVLGERVAFKVSTNAPGSWFKLKRFVPLLLPDPWAPVRGGN